MYWFLATWSNLLTFEEFYGFGRLCLFYKKSVCTIFCWLKLFFTVKTRDIRAWEIYWTVGHCQNTRIIMMKHLVTSGDRSLCMRVRHMEPQPLRYIQNQEAKSLKLRARYKTVVIASLKDPNYNSFDPKPSRYPMHKQNIQRDTTPVRLLLTLSF